jgi:hypothetical protein
MLLLMRTKGTGHGKRRPKRTFGPQNDDTGRRTIRPTRRLGVVSSTRDTIRILYNTLDEFNVVGEESLMRRDRHKNLISRWQRRIIEKQ